MRPSNVAKTSEATNRENYWESVDAGYCGTCRKNKATHGKSCNSCVMNRKLYFSRNKKGPSRPLHCSNCYQEGHNVRTCTLNAAQAAKSRQKEMEKVDVP